MDLFKLRAVIGLDTSEYERGIKSSSSLFDKAAGGIKKTAKTVGKTVAVGLGAAATAIGTLIKSSTTARGELEQNLGGSNQVFKEFAKTIQTEGVQAYKNLGLSQSDYLATANKMGALLQGSGFAIEESMNMTTAAMQRAADVASIMGLDTSAAMEAVAGAAKGNFTMMDNLGVAINDTALAQYAMSKGIKKSTQEMSTQEKVGLAMELFLEKTAYAAGNYARENATLAGSLSTAKAAFDNWISGAGTAEQLVESVLGAAQVVTASLVTILPDLAQGIGTLVAGLAPMLPGLFEQLLPAVLSGAVTLLNGLVSQLPTLVPIVINALFDLMLGTTENNLSLFSIALSIIQGIGTGLINSLPLLKDRALELIGVFVSNIESGAQTLIDIGASILNYISGGLLGNEEDKAKVQTFFSDLMSGISTALSTLSESWALIWPQLQLLAQSAIEGLQTAWVTFGQPVFDILSGIVTGLLESWTLIWPQLQSLAQSALEGIAGIVTGLQETWALVWPQLQLLAQSAFEGLQTAWTTVAQPVFDVLSSIVTGLQETWAAVWPQLQSLVQSALDGIQTGWTTVGQPAFDAISAVASALLESWNIIWPSLQSLVQAAFDTISVAWTSIGQPVFTLIKSIVSSVIGFVGRFFSENFNTMGTTASDVLTTLSTNVSTVFTAIATFWTETLQPVLVAIGGFLEETLLPVWETVFSGIQTLVTNTFDGIITLWNDSLKPILTGITTFLSGVFTLDWTTAWTGIQTIVSGVFSGIGTLATTTWTNIQTTISTAIEAAKTTVSNAIEAIKGFFDFEFEWPDIPTPHFTVTPKGWKAGDLLKGTIPSIGISWYANAMNNPMLLRGATIFGMQDGQFLGGGEAGPEIVAGANTVQRMIFDAVRAAIGSGAGGIVVNQNIYSEAKTAADLMLEARWEAERAVLTGV